MMVCLGRVVLDRVVCRLSGCLACLVVRGPGLDRRDYPKVPVGSVVEVVMVMALTNLFYWVLLLHSHH